MLRLLSRFPRVGARRLVAAALAVLALGAGCGLAVAAGVSIPRLGINVRVPADKAAALARLASVGTTDSSAAPAPAPSFEPRPIPARMLGPDAPVPVPPSLLRPRNGWLASDGRTLVAVYAGAAGSDRAVGRIVIVRQDLVAGKQTVRTIDAGPTGALAIAGAPLGRSVETSAQAGHISLRTVGGRLLVLDLRVGRILLDPYKVPLR